MFIRQRIRWSCGRCGYSLRGLDEAADGSIKCPECGTVQVFERSVKWRRYVGMPAVAAIVANECACLVVLLLANGAAERVFISFRALAAAALLSVMFARSMALDKLRELDLGTRRQSQALLPIVFVATGIGLLAGIIGCVLILVLAP